MNLTSLIILLVVIVGLFALKHMSFVSAAKARQLLNEGALVVDVRSPEEFNSRHIKGAINLPLGNLSAEAPRRLPDKGQPLLLHCLSGTRSGIAKGQLKGLGYTSVFNLGSFGRAEAIARASSQQHGVRPV